MSIVHMKRVTASEARKNWFRLLDEVATGTVVRIERRGITILVQRAEETPPDARFDYSSVLRVPQLEDASRWGWEWTGPPGGLEPREIEPGDDEP